jgi:simple sugar transport system ATP-binding protein
MTAEGAISEAAFEMRGIVKRYGKIPAVEDVDFSCGAGVVHAIAGENGAGKSTLMKVLYGLVRPERGTMRVEGAVYSPEGPCEALSRGVGMVHQHFMLVSTLTVLENAILGVEPTRGGGLLDRGAARASVKRTSEKFGLDLELETRVENLSVGERQRLEILKVLLRGARILILDEPTAVLVPSETRKLFAALRSLAQRGTTIVFITHKLREVFEYAERVTVMRRGRVIANLFTKETDARELSRLMVGREPPRFDARARRAAGEVVFRAEDLAEPRIPNRKRRLSGVSFEVHEGEIVGIAGVAGNGQSELVEMIAGLRPFEGESTLSGASIRGLDARNVRRLGLALVPEDRCGEGVIGEMTVSENLVLGREGERRFRNFLSFDRKALRRHAEERIRAFDIRPVAPNERALALSGGNQQKLVIAREVEGSPRLLVAAQPTRGVDIGAQEAIHAAILGLREAGVAVILVSSDLSEILDLADRILVLFEGQVQAEFRRGEVDEETIGLAMTGSWRRAS